MDHSLREFLQQVSDLHIFYSLVSLHGSFDEKNHSLRGDVVSESLTTRPSSAERRLALWGAALREERDAQIFFAKPGTLRTQRTMPMEPKMPRATMASCSKRIPMLPKHAATPATGPKSMSRWAKSGWIT